MQEPREVQRLMQEGNGIPEQGIPSVFSRSSGEAATPPALPWHEFTAERALREVGGRWHGLDSAEVEERRERYGRNVLSVKPPPSLLSILVRQFMAPLVLVLVVAAGLATYLGEIGDTTIVAVTLAVTVAFGFVQEAKAEKALHKLKTTVRPAARVLRDGKIEIVDASSLVFGDTIAIEAGDMVPADARILSSHDAGTDESALTGEAMIVTKSADQVPEAAPLAERRPMLWQGTLMTRGSAVAVVTAVGGHTEWSKVVRSLAEVRDRRTPLQEDLWHLTAWAMKTIALAVAVFLAVGIYRGVETGELVLLALALAVSAVPEGITVTITAVLAFGMIRLLDMKALVRRLVSAETLGSVSVLCLDKTGTLTEGRMKVVETSGERRRALAVAIRGIGAEIADESLPEDDWKAVGDPTEVAVLQAAISDGLAKAYLSRKMLDDLPFSSERRYRASVSEADGKATLVVVGSPETVLKRCSRMESGHSTVAIGESEKASIQETLVSWNGRGIRTLALAYEDLSTSEKAKEAIKRDSGLVFVSLIGLADTLRSDAAETVAKLHKAGVRTVMVTGDNPVTASAVAKEVGMASDRVVSWDEVAEGEEPEGLYARTDIFARVPPADKLRIVRGLQALGNSVAMTGDGVNDAPALKQADIGVVMGSGQDVAKGIADLVLLDDRLDRIYRAVVEGRKVYENIRKIAVFLVYDSLVETAVIIVTTLLGLPIPFLPAQVLWVNVIADTLPSMGYAWEDGERESRTAPPRKKGERLLPRPHKAFMVVLGASTALLLLALYVFVRGTSGDMTHVRTMVFVGLGIDSLFVAYSLRSLRNGIRHISPLTNPFMDFALVSGLLMYVVGIYVPQVRGLLHTSILSLADWSVLVAFGVLHLVLSELYKAIFLRPYYRRQVAAHGV